MSGTIENNLRFPGQYFDSETGLYYNWHRYYRAEVGRYMRGDPVFEYLISTLKSSSCSKSIIGDNRIVMKYYKRLHLYIYVKNSPINSIDPKGLIEIPSELVNELYKEIIEEILTMVINKTIGGLTGAVCASRFCKRKVIPKDWLMDAFAECGSIWADYPDLPTGITSSEEFVSACADECFRITHTEKFKKICCIK